VDNRMKPALLTAHRWLGELREKLWRCVPEAAVLRSPGLDPMCPGCRMEIRYDDIPKLERFCGHWMAEPMGQEALALQLDIVAVKKEAETREEFFRPVVKRHE